MTALIAIGSEATPIQPPLGPSSSVVGMELSTPTARIVLGQGEAHQAIEGAQGLGGPTIVTRDRTSLIIDGSSDPFGDPWEVGPLTIRLPLHVRGDSPVDLDRRVEDLMEALRSRHAGAGGAPAKTRLTVTRADGSVRWIEGWRQQDADLTPRRTSLHSRVLTVELRCPDPWPKTPLRQSVFSAGSTQAKASLEVVTDVKTKGAIHFSTQHLAAGTNYKIGLWLKGDAGNVVLLQDRINDTDSILITEAQVTKEVTLTGDWQYEEIESGYDLGDYEPGLQVTNGGGNGTPAQTLYLDSAYLGVNDGPNLSGNPELDVDTADWFPYNGASLQRVTTEAYNRFALPLSVRGRPVFRLARSVGFGVPRELLVGGQVAAPVEWTITGPCTEVTVESAAGRRWRLDATLDGGETAKVYADDRRPGSGLDRVLVNGAPAWSSLVERDLFHLLPGTDSVTVTVPGAGSATRVVAEWNPRTERLA